MPRHATRRACHGAAVTREGWEVGAHASSGWRQPLQGSLAATAAALLFSAQPAFADLPTVEPASVMSLAKPLKAQSVNKGKVWLVFVLGAAGLFSAAVLLENNERFFPAISRANKAMAATRKAMQAKEQQEEAIDAELAQEQGLQAAVEAGLAEARQRTGGTNAASRASPSGAMGPLVQQRAAGTERRQGVD
ncbi:hypothetical protein WJX81_007015 [Elliptochloris bilobata]|uniref:Transmembrane protein n=1 Tax=Elliptochloris bilobata TaxID=381761 RepID=A0AAW1SKB6_9CHLO